MTGRAEWAARAAGDRGVTRAATGDGDVGRNATGDGDVTRAATPDTPGGSGNADTTPDKPATSNANVTQGDTEKPLVNAIAQAIRDGAQSWAAIGRVTGVSRTWARRIGDEAGLILPQEPGPPRSAVLSVRVQASGLTALDDFAAAEAAKRGTPVTRSEAARLLLAEALAVRSR